MSDLSKFIGPGLMAGRRGGIGMGQVTHPSPEMQAIMDRIFKQNLALARHKDDFAVYQGRPMIAGDDRQLESYPPTESWNPIPGKATTEVYNTDPTQTQNLITGDMLHHLAQTDPIWADMKQRVAPSGMSSPRQDEFLMGYLTPDAADEWRNVYTLDQKKQLEIMRSYLQRGSLAPGMLR